MKRWGYLMSNIQIVYFSGTGGTKRIAESFEQELVIRNYCVNKLAIDYNENKNILENTDLIILIFAVHAFDAPTPIYSWFDKVDLKGKKIAVISVSGGGEIWPNTGCRNNCCKMLEEKGGEVVYEKMMVMPSNFVVNANDHITMWLLNAISEKVNKILDPLLAGKHRRTKYHKGFLRTYLSKLEKDGAKKFAPSLIINDSCSGCGWCAKNCPVNNIELLENRPIFKESCVVCFRCIYGCPSKSIKSKNFMVLKKGYNLMDVEKRMEGIELLPVRKCAKGLIWVGVKKYLLDKDGY